MFVACMLDLFTQKIAGWAIDSHIRKSLVHDALKITEFRNRHIFHSDKSSQYAAHDIRNYLQRTGYR